MTVYLFAKKFQFFLDDLHIYLVPSNCVNFTQKNENLSVLLFLCDSQYGIFFLVFKFNGA